MNREKHNPNQSAPKQFAPKKSVAEKNTHKSSPKNEQQNQPKNPRKVAFEILEDVRVKDAYANLVLPHKIKEARLDTRDAALVTELSAGTLRNQGTYDRIIELAASRDKTTIDPSVLDILRLGSHQLLNMRIPIHAAVNESVKLAKKTTGFKTAGFINAVLRKIAATSLADWKVRIQQENDDPARTLAEHYSHPEWIVEAFREALKAEGRETELLELLEADNIAPRVSLTNLNPTIEMPKTLTPGISPIGYEIAGGDPQKIIAELDDTGFVRVQDQGSQLAALVLSEATNIKEGETWADLCAGPGGKTAVLASRAKQHAVTVYANEVAKHRADLVRTAVSAFEKNVVVGSADGREAEAFHGLKYDRILVDAPCSGIGALRRRPEARWRKQQSDIAQLKQLQLELLESAAAHLKPNGYIAYVTCSPHLEETRGVVDHFLTKQTDFKEVSAKEVLNQITTQNLDLGDGDELSAQLWPHRHATDAMFIALITHKP